MNKKILVTGAAGFIGSRLVEYLVSRGEEVVGIDNINNYYDPNLKIARLKRTGIDIPKDTPLAKTVPCSGYEPKEVEYPELPYGVEITSRPAQPTPAYPQTYPYRFIRLDITDATAIDRLFAEEKFDIVINLAAQAGVRYSIENPRAYIESNINGFVNILEGCRANGVKHLVYASSSSVYGLNGKVPFSEHDGIAHPVSLYAATKKSNELMAHVYSKLYGIPTTGLRFFTVYGPWGRPDMSPYLFIDAILHDRPIKVFNEGDMWRDFTYIDDIVEGIVRIKDIIPEAYANWNDKVPDPSSSCAPYRIYNIGNQHPTKLLDYIQCIEDEIGHEAKKEFLPMQPGDVYQTYADSSELAEATAFSPATTLRSGIHRTVEWFKDFYNC